MITISNPSLCLSAFISIDETPEQKALKERNEARLAEFKEQMGKKYLLHPENSKFVIKREYDKDPSKTISKF